MLTLAFVGRELYIEKPFLNLRLLAREGIVPILLILAGFRFIILSTAYIIPTYLQVVQDYRELQVGAVLLWIALPQFLIVLPLGWLLSRVDARWILAIGAILIGVACLMGTCLTQDWATDDFLPSQILQAIGQSFALTAVVVLAVKSMNPADVLTIGTLFQTTRLFGGEIGTAFMQTFVRVREQVHSNLIGLHVDSLGGQTADRLAAYRNAVGAHSSDVGVAAERATSLLGVRRREAGRGSLLYRRISRRRRRRLCLPHVHRSVAAALTGRGRRVRRRAFNLEVSPCDPTSFQALSSLITSFPTTPRNTASCQSCKDSIRWFSFSAVEATVPRTAAKPRALFNSIARWRSAIAGSSQ